MKEDTYSWKIFLNSTPVPKCYFLLRFATKFTQSCKIIVEHKLQKKGLKEGSQRITFEDVAIVFCINQTDFC